MKRICNKKCPEHGDKCRVMRMCKQDSEIAKKVFGQGLNTDFETHTHLCLANPNKPHFWDD